MSVFFRLKMALRLLMCKRSLLVLDDEDDTYSVLATGFSDEEIDGMCNFEWKEELCEVTN